MIALQELLTLLPCPPLFLRFPCPSPVALYFATFPFVATTTATIDATTSSLLFLLFLLLPSPFSSPFSLLSASSPRRVRTHQRVKHALAVKPEFFFLFFSLCILCLALSISPPFASPFILSLSFPIRLTTIFLNSSIRRILPYHDILSISPSSPSFRPSHFRVLFFARFARASVSPSRCI